MQSMSQTNCIHFPLILNSEEETSFFIFQATENRGVCSKEENEISKKKTPGKKNISPAQVAGKDDFLIPYKVGPYLEDHPT